MIQELVKSLTMFEAFKAIKQMKKEPKKKDAETPAEKPLEPMSSVPPQLRKKDADIPTKKWP